MKNKTEVHKKYFYPKNQSRNRNLSNPKSRSNSSNRSRSRNKDKSKIRTKSYSVFKFSQKSVMLTYSRTDKTGIQKQELGDYLYNTFKPKVCVVALEHHQDGNPHLHVWLEWEEVFNSRDPRIFDFKKHHPNIGIMLEGQKNTRLNALRYMIKEDNDLYSIGLDIKTWIYNNTNHKKNIAQDLISNKLSLVEAVNYNPNLLYNYRNLSFFILTNTIFQICIPLPKTKKIKK